MRTTVTTLSLLLALGAASAATGQDGPGLGNRRYGANERFEKLATIGSGSGVPRGTGFVTMHRGYLLVIFSSDSGGGDGSGGFAMLDVSDPRSPRTAFTTANNPAYGRGSPNDAGDIREAHGFTISGDILCTPTNEGRGTGLQFWDLSRPLQPRRLSFLALPGLSGGDYSPTPWWVAWQGGHMVYVAGTSAGLYLVDASDPAHPVLADRGGAPNPIPPQQVGLNEVQVVFACGNRLMAAGHGRGLAMLDISDPLHPLLQASEPSASAGYSVAFNGGRVYAADDPVRIYDVSDPARIVRLADGPDVAGKGGYGVLQDGVFHYGSSDRYVKLDVSGPTPRSLGTARPRGFILPDWDFATPLGNVAWLGNDHGYLIGAGVIVVHDPDPDQRGPEVNLVDPPDGATNVALTARIGLTFTDQVDLRSLNPSTVVVRRRGTSQGLPGRFSQQAGIVNFWPDAPLEPGVVYEVIVPAGGVKDFVGNGNPREFSAAFSTGSAVYGRLQANPAPAAGAIAGDPVLLQAGPIQGAAGPLEYAWDFGDGQAEPWGSSAGVSHVWAAPGRYRVVLQARTHGGLQWTSAAFSQTVVGRPTPRPPTASASLAWDPLRRRVWTVNPDNDSVTCGDAAGGVRLFEVPVERGPRSLAFAPDGSLWVVCQDAAAVVVLEPGAGQRLDTLRLPPASAPFGLAFAPAGDAAYVTLEALGQLLKLDPAARRRIGALDVGPRPRGLAVSGDSTTVLVSRFLSPADRGEVRRVNGPGLFLIDTIGLEHDPGPDAEDMGRGVPNTLGAPAISPDGQRAWVPGKKDNVRRGQRRDGQPLTFESSVRAIAARLDLVAGQEDLLARIDFNDREGPSAVAYSPLGDLAFVALRGSNAVEVRDAWSGDLVLALERTGRAPQGVLVADEKLFVHNYLSRSVKVYDVASLLRGANQTVPELAEWSTVAHERLAPQVLRGKQVFYDASDRRLNLDGYISCASCHLDGDQDGRVWDFTDRGEGLRNTISLLGRRGTGHGPVHWTANFDEIQDFEHDIRNAFAGRGLLDDADFHAAGRDTSLGGPKAGLSPDLDALAAYVTSLAEVPASPWRNPDGSLTADGLAGRAVFLRQGCADCHGGADFTDSARGQRHDVGTLGPGSGQRLGAALDGLDTPTLRGVWATAPYLHDGSAATLADVVARGGPAHGGMSALPPAEQRQLVAYLLQLDDREPPAAGLRPRVTLEQPLDAPSGALELRYLLDGEPTRIGQVRLRLDGGAWRADLDRDGRQDVGAVLPGLHRVEVELLDPSGASLGTDALSFTLGLPRGGVRLVVSHLQARSSRGYALGLLDQGERLYTDRRYTFGDVGGLKGTVYVRTANDDKRSQGDDFLRFRVNAPVTVTVAFDRRARGRPAWLNGWREVGRLGTSDVGRRLYVKDFPAGQVVLGGNSAPRADSMYSVAITPR